MSAFDDYLNYKIDAVKQQLMSNLIEIGEIALDEAIQSGDYIDGTGNLRSSIYFVVAEDGIIHHIGGGIKVKYGDMGVEYGKMLAEKLAAESSGMVLILVAGMDYAAIVETRRNVLSSAELVMDEHVNKLLTDLGLAK